MIKRILKLAEDNERVVIVDPETERAFVILPLSTYERLVDECAFDDEEFDEVDDNWTPPLDEALPTTDQSLIDSIDRDIAAWKVAQERMSEPALDELTLTPMPGDEAPMKPPASEEEEKFYIEPVA